MRDVMTRELVKVSHDASCHHCLEQMKENDIRHLMVFNGDIFVGVISLRHLAALMAQGTNTKDLMVNFVGGFVLLMVLGVIGFLVYMVPEMLTIIERFFP